MIAAKVIGASGVKGKGVAGAVVGSEERLSPKRIYGHFSLHADATSSIDWKPLARVSCVGTRINLDWNQIETSRENYDFSLLENRRTELKGGSLTLQGKRKAWGLMVPAGRYCPFYIVDQAQQKPTYDATTLTDLGATFTSDVTRVGPDDTDDQRLWVEGQATAVYIASVDSDTQITISGAWPSGTPAAGQGYAISDRNSNIGVYCMNYTKGGARYIIPAPWDTTMLRQYKRMLRRVALKYDDYPDFAFIMLGGPNGALAEMYLTSSIVDTNDEATNGLLYTQQRYIDAWKSVIDEASRLFKRTRWGIWYNDVPRDDLDANGPYPGTGTKRDLVPMKAVHAYALTRQHSNGHYQPGFNGFIWNAPPLGATAFLASKRGANTFIMGDAPATLTDNGANWDTDEWAGAICTCAGKTMTVASNTGTVLTGTAAWSGGQPANNQDYTLSGFNAQLGTANCQNMGSDLLWTLARDSLAARPIIQIGNAKVTTPPHPDDEPAAPPTRGTNDGGLSITDAGNGDTEWTMIGQERMDYMFSRMIDTIGAGASEVTAGRWADGGDDSLDRVITKWQASIIR